MGFLKVFFLISTDDWRKLNISEGKSSWKHTVHDLWEAFTSPGDGDTQTISWLWIQYSALGLSAPPLAPRPSS